MEFLQHQIGESDAEVGQITSAWCRGYAETAEEILVNLVAVVWCQINEISTEQNFFGAEYVKFGGHQGTPRTRRYAKKTSAYFGDIW